jgi:hypothetical protein
MVYKNCINFLETYIISLILCYLHGYCNHFDIIYIEESKYEYFEGSPVEVGSNTSTITLRVVGGDEKGTQCLGV